MTFNEKEWGERIKDPFWYKEVPFLLKQMMELKSKDGEAFKEIRERIYSFFEKQLKEERVALGDHGKNFDAERLPIDTIVIHHTHGDERMTNERLSAMELLRLYAPYFAHPTYEDDKEIENQPIYSGHFRGKEQVFYPYHWIVRKDGTKDQLLRDDEIGWHAGDWNINCRSIAISLDGNYENSIPSDEEIRAIIEIIKNSYPQVEKERVLGHREINLKTTCPSNLFLDKDGKTGWKQKILQNLGKFQS